MQTLVKRGYMRQETMISLQQLLMAVSTYAAIFVIRHVRAPLAMASLMLNLVHRGADVTNTAAVTAFALVAEFGAEQAGFPGLASAARVTVGTLLPRGSGSPAK